MPRLTAEQSRERLIDAATSLFRDRGPAQVSVREIATHAGVNHGLVHRHFGGKQGLVTAVLGRILRATGQAIGDGLHEDPAQAVERGLDLLMQERWVARVMADLLAQSGSPEGIPEASMMPILRKRGELDEQQALHLAVAEAAVLGWMLFEPLVARGTGLDRMSETERRRLLSQTLAATLVPLLDRAVDPDASKM